MDLLTAHKVLVSHMCELLEDLLCHAMMLVEHVTNISHCLTDLVRFSTLHCLDGCTLFVRWIWPGVNWLLTFIISAVTSSSSKASQNSL